jgi:hypothetical protein
MMIVFAYILQAMLEPAQITVQTTFDTNVHVNVSASYPKLAELSHLTRYANEAIRQEAIALHDHFVEEMREPIVELYEEDGDERTLFYDLHLVYEKPHLLEFYGSHYQYTGGAHGMEKFITKVFWQDGEHISALTLDDLLLPHGRDLLYHHCHTYFKESRGGYYSYDDIDDWDPFQPEHLDTFLLTDEGLLLIFQNYTVCGLMDEPITLLVPHKELRSILKPAFGTLAKKSPLSPDVENPHTAF